MNQRLKPSQSIRKSRVFQIVHKRGQFIRSKLFNVWIYDGPEAFVEGCLKPRIGIVVSKKVSLRANKRNLWKRRIREAFRLHQHYLIEGIAILIKVKKQEMMPAYQDVATEFRLAMVKAKVWK